MIFNKRPLIYIPRKKKIVKSGGSTILPQNFMYRDNNTINVGTDTYLSGLYPQLTITSGGLQKVNNFKYDSSDIYVDGLRNWNIICVGRSTTTTPSQEQQQFITDLKARRIIWNNVFMPDITVSRRDLQRVLIFDDSDTIYRIMDSNSDDEFLFSIYTASQRIQLNTTDLSTYIAISRVMWNNNIIENILTKIYNNDIRPRAIIIHDNSNLYKNIPDETIIELVNYGIWRPSYSISTLKTKIEDFDLSA